MDRIKLEKYYVIESELGRGGMAVVYLAHDNKFDTNVAIKVLNKEYVHNENIRKRFLSEARNMFRMSHPNIIKVIDLIEENDTVAFVMEYIEGETLKEHLERKGKLKDDEIKTIFSQMLEAVGYVHEQNLVHRDIKPSNFMIDKKGKVKLMDFGIAKTLDSSSVEYDQTTAELRMGTPRYMSPEQVKSSKDAEPASDIYSLGVLLWQVVMGVKPYEDLSEAEIQSEILREPLGVTNTKWDGLIQKATNKESEKRYESCEGIRLEMSRLFLEDDRTIIVNPSPRSPTFVDTLGIEFVWVEGNPLLSHTEEKLMSQVPLNGFYISKFPITQSIWQRVMGSNPSHWKRSGSESPVENVSWLDCKEFLQSINRMLQSTYRLPTEFEWEFAASGGNKGLGFSYAGSNCLEDVAWCETNRVIKSNSLFGPIKRHLGTSPVGKKKPNELNIFDMSGNVWEWCDIIQVASDPSSVQMESTNLRPAKGGSWLSKFEKCKPTYSGMIDYAHKDNTIGFRVIFVP